MPDDYKIEILHVKLYGSEIPENTRFDIEITETPCNEYGAHKIYEIIN